MRHIRLFWHQSKPKGNFGDELSPWIIKNLSGKKVQYIPILNINNNQLISFKSIIKKWMTKEYKIVDFKSFFEWTSIFNKKVIISVGSIISWYHYKNVIVWGSGILTGNDEIYPAKFLAVRGKYTQKRLEQLGYKSPETIGDPAVLCDIIYKPKISKKYKIGIIPHVFHFDTVIENIKSDEILVVNLHDSIEKVIDDILSCEYTISTSLHGIIVSHTYQIPSLWVHFQELKKKLNGDNIKFKDYFSALNIHEYDAPFFSFSDVENTENFVKKLQMNYNKLLLPERKIMQSIQINLLNSAPFQILEKFKIVY